VEELQKWYAVETNSNKLILVNPNDLNIELNFSYNTEKSGSISHLFSKMSLAAPFLAAVKKEVIAFTELPDSGTNSSCSASQTITDNVKQADQDAAWAIQNLFPKKPEFLTIISSPRAIPDSKFEECSGSWQNRFPRDWFYASLGNKEPEINVGRIYGISLSDASAYIARDLEYEFLRNKIYSSNWTSISVGHSFLYCSDYAREIKNNLVAAGYNAYCYTEKNYPECTKNKKPPYNEYKNKNYINFNDHGAPYAWWQTLSYKDIPWLNLSLSIGAACLTNNYWQYSNKNFGAHMIRKGAIGYIGAVGVTYTTTGIIVVSGIRRLGSNSNLTLGKMFLMLGMTGEGYDKDYSLLGDPTLQPKFKHIDWQ
jgi:hypothetical protein